MSHHFDSPTSILDGRLNPCDVFVFPAPATLSMSTLILTVNPDAGRSTPISFRPDALYEFVIASDGGTVEDRAFRLQFSEPAADGRQQMTVLYAEGQRSRSGVDGSVLGCGDTADTFTLEGGGSAWFGLVSDPFWGDGAASMQFLQGLAADQYLPQVFTDTPHNVFGGRNVTAIALQVPNSALGGADVALWARISLYGHAPQQQVNRMGNPMVRPLFFSPPGPDVEELNAGSPAADIPRHTSRLQQLAAKVAELRGLSDPAEHAGAVARAFLPDVLHYRPAQPARYCPGTGNGRGLHDDAFGTTMSVLNGSPLGVSVSPHAVVTEFPYLAAAGHDDIPALADLPGLREFILQLRPTK